jgi:hypothetical protein
MGAATAPMRPVDKRGTQNIPATVSGLPPALLAGPAACEISSFHQFELRTNEKQRVIGAYFFGQWGCKPYEPVDHSHDDRSSERTDLSAEMTN